MDIDVQPGTSKEQPQSTVKTENTEEASSSQEQPQSTLKTENTEAASSSSSSSKVDIKYFECATCILRVQFEYFGKNPPWYKHYRLLEEAYVIEDPFSPPKQNQIIILGAHCVKCNRIVCKDTTCSIYYEGTYCIKCAKSNLNSFPASVKAKLNRIVDYK